jgi:hypothetical protein
MRGMRGVPTGTLAYTNPTATCNRATLSLPGGASTFQQWTWPSLSSSS